MPAVDWTLLRPHQPLHRRQDGYVTRPDGAAKLARLVQAGANPIAVVGPMGSGKSTELGVAYAQLEQEGYVIGFGLLDHAEAVGVPSDLLTKVSPLAILSRLLAHSAKSQKIDLSADLNQKLFGANVIPTTAVTRTVPLVTPVDLLRETLREVRQASGNKKAALCCDGLEKYSVERARETIDALLELRGEATIVLVIPTALVVGPSSYEVVSTFKLFPIGPVPVRDDDGAEGREGRQFLKSIVYTRLALFPPHPPGLDEVLDRAAEASGGIPRAFLQLVLDAATYARLADRDTPTMEDLRDAMSDHAESLRRLLNKGDIAALREADGTEGLEVEPERRLRFLTHGLLLEYKVGDRTVVHPAPLLAGILARAAAA